MSDDTVRLQLNMKGFPSKAKALLDDEAELRSLPLVAICREVLVAHAYRGANRPYGSPLSPAVSGSGVVEPPWR